MFRSVDLGCSRPTVTLKLWWRQTSEPDQHLSTPPKPASQPALKLLLLLYVTGLSERIKRVCRPLGVKTVCTSRGTLRSSVVQVKQPREDKKRGVIYEVPWKDCECVYIGETSRTLEKWLSEHKNAVKKHDTKNGIAVHSWTNQHQVDWEAAKTREMEGNYLKRQVLEALHIYRQQHTSNLDCGLAINSSWLPLLNTPSLPWQLLFLPHDRQLLLPHYKFPCHP